MRIVYFGKGERGAACLDYLLVRGWPIAGLVLADDDEGLAQRGQSHKIPMFNPRQPNSTSFAAQLKELHPDIFVLTGYNKILKPIIFQLPPLGTVNLHGGRLPDYRGAAPINWQIINGETKGACVVLYVDEGIDTGDIIRQEYYDIAPHDTHESILKKTLEMFPGILEESLQEIKSGQVNRQKQDVQVGCYYTRRYPRDSQILWDKLDDIQVHNLVRAMNGPYPAAFSFLKSEKVEILKTELLERDIRGAPGRIPLKEENAVIVIARNRGLKLIDIRVNGECVDTVSFFSIGDEFECMKLTK